MEQAIREALRRRDKGIRKIAREMGVGVSVIQRVKAGAAPQLESQKKFENVEMSWVFFAVRPSNRNKLLKTLYVF